MNSRLEENVEDLEVQLRIWRTAISAIVQMLALIAIMIGTVIVVGDPRRLESPTFAFIRDTPGTEQTWGAVWLMLGLLLLITSWLDSHVGMIGEMLAHYALGFFCLVFAVALTTSVLQESMPLIESAIVRPSLIGIPTYAGLGVIHIIFGTLNYGLWRRHAQR